MPLIPIDDPGDSRLAVFRDLKLSNLTRNRPHFITEGEKLLRSLLASSYPLRCAAVEERYAERIRSLVPEETPLYVLSTDAIQALAGYQFHLGVLACGERLRERSAEERLERLVARQPGGFSFLLALPHVDNPDNLGAILRTAEIFGAAGIITGNRSPDPLSRRVLRVSMGASLRVPVIESDGLHTMVAELRERDGFRLVAAVTDDDATPVRHFDRPERLVLMLGNESHGLDEEWVRIADFRVTIPMRGGADSLNVGAAAAIFCYELGGAR